MLELDLLRLGRREGTSSLRTRLSSDHPLFEHSGLDLRGPVEVDLRASLLPRGEVSVVGSLVGRHEGPCRRCLEPVTSDLQLEIELVYGEEDAVRSDGVDEVRFLDGRATFIDLAEPIREELILAAPVYPTCSPDCRGLCPRCGADRNRGDCSCRE